MAHNARWWSGGLAALVAASLLSAPATSAEAAPRADQADQAGPAGAEQGTVRLVTGDRVTLYGNGQASVLPEPAREDVGFMTYQHGGDVHVLPTDAAPLVADGRVDPQLFNVSALIDYGYDEAGRDDLPLLVTHGRGLRTDARGRLAEAGARVLGEFRSANSLAVRADHADLPELWRELVAGRLALGGEVWLDRLLQPALADSVPQVGAPDAWTAGYDGTGVTVAVLDTGVDAAHPDLAGTVVASENFTSEDDRDVVGHGTHVASTIAGTGAASGGANQGVAPGASLLSGKVCEVEGCPTSSILAGMEWAAGQGADVVNMSLGGGDTPGVDPLEQAVADLTASAGTLFVVAAGNDGRPRAVGSPASADAAVAVGAVDGADQLAGFSSQGPRVGDSALKPDITAPGVDVTAARSQHSSLTGGDYTSQQGTSMATPHVAGGAAILAQRHPDWSPALLKSALMGSATPNPALTGFAQGAGRLEVFGAVNQQVTASPPSVSLGAIPADTPPGTVVARTVTYRNHGTGAVTLTLALAAEGPGGDPAPAGMFSLSATTVTVPAGGEAPVTLTADLDLAGPAGIYSGRITATGDGVEVGTPFGLERAASVTLTHTGRTGGDPTAYGTVLLSVSGSGVYTVSSQPGPVELTIPAGIYLVNSFVVDAGPGGVQNSILTVPRLDATGTHSLDLDARLAGELDITVPDPAAQPWAMDIGVELTVPGVGVGGITSNIRTWPTYTAHLGPDPHVVGFRSKIATTYYVPGPGGTERDAPDTYHVGWFFDNQLPTGLVRHVSAADLATVDARHMAHVADSLGYKGAVAHPADGLFSAGGSVGVPMGLPFDRAEHYSTDGNIRWQTVFTEHQEVAGGDDIRVVSTQSTPIGYSPGQSVTQWWNRPVYGPFLATPSGPLDWATRFGDEMFLRLPMFGDGDGHAGFPAVAGGRLVLSRGGEPLWDLPYRGRAQYRLQVPPSFGSYQLVATAERGGPAELSTEVSSEWTFSSGTVNGDWPLRLALWSVRMIPPLDGTNTAPAGEPIAIPVLAAAPPSSPAAGLNELTVEFSVDDGASWQPATVTPAPDGGHLAELTHPDLTGFVSLRATATDWAGNAVVQEVIRAYRIG